MADKEYNPFAGESGLKDDWDGVIVDAWFATNPQYNAGQSLLLHLKIQEEGGSEDEVEQRYATGPDWGSYDGGDTAEHPKGDKKGFNNQTAYYALIAAAMEAGAEDEMRARSAATGGAGPKRADMWKGLAFHWEVHTEKKSVPDDENPGKRKDIEVNRTLPTKFLGVRDGVNTGARETAAPAPVTPESPAVNAESGAVPVDSADPLSGIPAELSAQVKILAKTKDYPDWVDEVMALTGALDHASLVAGLGDESFYQRLKG